MQGFGVRSDGSEGESVDKFPEVFTSGHPNAFPGLSPPPTLAGPFNVIQSERQVERDLFGNVAYALPFQTGVQI